MAMSFGVMLVQDRPLAHILDWAVRFDDAGVDSLWVPEHLVNPSAVDSAWLDAWTLLAVLAERTTTCRLGPLVSNFVLHSPLELARLATTLDAISAGRLDLGLGLGGAPACRSAAGVHDDGPALAARFEQGVAALLDILADVPITLPDVPLVAGFAGPGSVRFAPACVQSPRPPIVIGGHGPRVLDTAARIADRWNVCFPPGVNLAEGLEPALLRLLGKFEQRAEAHGRSDRITRSILFDYAPGLEPSSRHEMVDLVGRMGELGFQECIVSGWPPRHDDTWAEELLTFLGQDLPLLQGL
jgi:alkanesulfonate monooxygenase SsuD/methylene tetrahydromethanopterin reductase-like flavin-dependent oxidoreductase (luciferase family)